MTVAVDVARNWRLFIICLDPVSHVETSLARTVVVLPRWLCLRSLLCPMAGENASHRVVSLVTRELEDRILAFLE